MKGLLPLLLLIPLPALSQQDQPPPPAQFGQTLDVVATTPDDAWGVPRDQVPANIQSLSADELHRGGAATAMERRLPGVQLREGQGSSWQPDLQFRGFSASPLLGIPQGLAVYQDGEPRSVLLSGRIYRTLSPSFDLEAHAHYRRQRLDTLNGDAASFAPCEDDGSLLCREGEETPLRDLSGQPLSADLGADAIENRTRTEQRSLGGGLQLTGHGEIGTRTFRTLVGITADSGFARYTAGTEIATLTPDRGTESLGIGIEDDRTRVESRTSNLSLSLLETVTLGARTTVDAALRWQRTGEHLRDRLGTALDGDHTFTALAPSLGITHGLGGTWTLFGNFGISSRVPTPVELTCANPDDPCRLPNAFLSDPPLRQVVARTLEVGIRGTWKTVHLSAALFRADSRNDILFISSGVLTGSGHFANVGRTRRQGAELLLQGPLPRGGLWTMAYSYLDATFQTAFVAPAPDHPDAVDGEVPVRAGNHMPLLPQHTVKAGVELPIGKARLGLDLFYESARYLQGDEANLLKPLGGFSRLNLDLSHPLGRRLAGFVEVDNLLDRNYTTFGLLGDAGEVLGEDVTDPRFLSPGAPRTFRMGLRFVP